MVHRSLAGLVLMALLLAPGISRAQLSQYNLPVESGILETHVDLQYQYSKSKVAADRNVSIVSLEGQATFGDSFELSANVPFLVHGWTSSPNEVAFGDLMIGFKARVFGLGDNLGIAVFANTTLPTHSGDFTREYAQIQAGGAATAKVLGFQLGGGIQTVWFIFGEGIPDTGLLGFYGYGRFPILGLLALQLSVEYFNSLHPDGDDNALLLTPSIEVGIAGIHAGIGVRVATTDDAMSLNLGRAALIANAGYRF